MAYLRRECKNLKITDKLKILNKVENGQLTVNEAAYKNNITARTVKKWKATKINLENAKENVKLQPLRKRIKRAKYEKINEAVYMWFCLMRKKRYPVNGPMIKVKALQLAKIEGQTSFAASEGWLGKWKFRYGIRKLSLTGEKLSADYSAAEKFKEEFAKEVEKEELLPCQIFNADETGLYFRMIPSTTLAGKEETEASNFKTDKNRLTLLVCANGDGSLKIPLCVIGKSENPRALKNIPKSNLPVWYTHQKKAWMNCKIFKEWFEDQFVPKVTDFFKSRGLPVKAVLLLDNAPSHPSSEELSTKNIKVQYLPPNTTSIIQPCDQGIIETTKKRYKSKYLMSLIEAQERNLEIPDYIKEINVKTAIDWASESWNEVKDSTISKCFKKIFEHCVFPSYSENLQEEKEAVVTDQQIIELTRKIDKFKNLDVNFISEWANSEDLPEMPTDQDIILLTEENLSERRKEPNDENCPIPESVAEKENLTPKKIIKRGRKRKNNEKIAKQAENRNETNDENCPIPESDAEKENLTPKKIIKRGRKRKNNEKIAIQAENRKETNDENCPIPESVAEKENLTPKRIIKRGRKRKIDEKVAEQAPALKNGKFSTGNKK